MFKSIMIVSFFVAVLTMVHTAPSEYGSKFDNVNLDDILNNDRLFNNYFKCLMETGKCTPEGEELKSEYFPFVYKLKVILKSF